MPRASVTVRNSLQEVRLTTNQDVPLDCTICLTTLYTGDLACIVNPCEHIFCLSCIRQWLDNNDFCPNCNCHLGTDSNTSPRNRRYHGQGASSRSNREQGEEGGAIFSFFGLMETGATMLQAYDRVNRIVGGIRRALNSDPTEDVVTVKGREIEGVRLWQIGNTEYRLPAANEFDYNTIRDLEEQEIDDLEFLETGILCDLYSYVGRIIHDTAMEMNASWYRNTRSGFMGPVLPDRSYSWRPSDAVRIGFACDNLKHFMRFQQQLQRGGASNTGGTTSSEEINVGMGLVESDDDDNIRDVATTVSTGGQYSGSAAAEIAKKIAYIVQVQGVAGYKPLSAIVIKIRSSCLGWLFFLLGYLFMSPIFILCLTMDIIVAPIIPIYALIYSFWLPLILPCCTHETFEEVLIEMCCPFTKGFDASMMECIEHHVKKCIIACDLDANRSAHAQRIARIASKEQERGGLDPYGLNSLIEEG
jgi:hypothetical protein